MKILLFVILSFLYLRETNSSSLVDIYTDSIYKSGDLAEYIRTTERVLIKSENVCHFLKKYLIRQLIPKTQKNDRLDF